MRIFLLSLAFMTHASLASAEQIYPGYEWRSLSSGIYIHKREDPFAGPVDGNSIVLINEDDAFIIDTHINPAATRAVVKKFNR